MDSNRLAIAPAIDLTRASSFVRNCNSELAESPVPTRYDRILGEKHI